MITFFSILFDYRLCLLTLVLFSYKTSAVQSVYFCAISSSSPVQNQLLLRHSVVIASPKPIVINHTQLFTIRFGTSVAKSKSGTYIFVLEVSLPNRKEKADLSQFVLEQTKSRALFVLETCSPNRSKDARVEMDSHKLSLSARHYSSNLPTIQIETRSKILISSWIQLAVVKQRGYNFSLISSWTNGFSPG